MSRASLESDAAARELNSATTLRIVYRVAAGVMACSALTLAPAVANACQPSPRAPWGAPDNDARVPENAPGLVWQGTGSPYRAKLTLDDAEIILEHKALADATLLVPRTPLISGRVYAFSYSDVVVHRFTATPAAMTPRVSGSLRTSASRQGPVTVSSYGGSCTVDIDAAIVDLEINPSPELAPWVAVTRYTTLVDGKVWAHSRFGRTDRPATSTYSMEYGARIVGQVFAYCGEGKPQGDDGVSPGKHHVTAVAEIAGLAVELPLSGVDIDLTCAPKDGGCSCGVVPRSQYGGLSASLALILAAALRRLVVRRVPRSR